MWNSAISGKENIGLLNERNETLQGVTSSIQYMLLQMENLGISS